MKILNIPNIITIFRIIIIPIFIIALIYQKFDYALYSLLLAGISDMFDGFLARVTNQKTQIGAFLDPLADKCLLITSFILFSVFDWIPKWVTIVVIARDLIVVIGWFLLYLIYNITKIKPTIIGKLSNASQVFLIAYILICKNFKIAPISLDWLLPIIITLAVVSGLQYMWRGLKES